MVTTKDDVPVFDKSESGDRVNAEKFKDLSGVNMIKTVVSTYGEFIGDVDEGR